MNRILAFFFFLLFLGGFALVMLKDLKSNESVAGNTVAPQADVNILAGIWRVEETADSNGESVQFAPDGALSGFAGCNSFFGSFVATDTTIEVGPLGMSRKACPLAVMNAESAFLRAIESSQRYSIKVDTLTLSNADGVQLILRLTKEQ